MTQWLEPEEVYIPEDLLRLVDGNGLVASVLVNRGITTAESARGFLDPDYYQPAPPTDLPGVIEAADRLDQALGTDEMIGVWGDFDADGVTSTALLLGSLRDLGGRVEFYVPDRATESHGVHIPSLQKLISRGIGVLLTCDTGSTEYEGISYARGQGVDVIITDHHDLGPQAPRSNAFVNPKRLPLEHPLRELAGVGTAYKLVEELHVRRGQPERARQELDLVALGQVADVAVLQKDVRYLVQRGIGAIQRTERVGLQSLMEVAGIEPSGVTEQQISFGLAPRLNALGRLSEATAAVELFTTNDVVRARTIATEMEALNVERQHLCNQVMEAAVSIIERDRDLLRHPVLVVDHLNWPAGVIGIVAGRLAQQYNRPTIIISTTNDGTGRGSARSVAGVDIREAIAAQEGLLHRFGGHPMAAGLSLAAGDIPAFREAMVRTVSEMAGEKPPEPTLDISAYVHFSDLSLDLAAQMEKLAPFGAGNPPIHLATREVRIISQTTIGRADKHRRLTMEDRDGQAATVLWWQGGSQDLPEGPFDLAYTLHTRDFLGHPEIQLHWEDMRPIEGMTISVSPPSLPAIQVTDHRAANQPHDRLQDILSEFEAGQVAVWGEGLDESRSDIHGRAKLDQAEVLVIWTVPPGPQELAQALEVASPQRVVLFDQYADLDAPRLFLAKLTGLLKYDLRARGGRCSVAALAAALGHRERTVRQGIEWLAARGQIRIIDENNHTLLLDFAHRRPADDADSVYQELQSLLVETAAYRAFFRRADVRALLPGAGAI
jgi:single-stranded-DNA-specific exonuclease